MSFILLLSVQVLILWLISDPVQCALTPLMQYLCNFNINLAYY